MKKVIDESEFWEGRFSYQVNTAIVHFENSKKKHLRFKEKDSRDFIIQQKDERGQFEWRSEVSIMLLWEEVISGLKSKFDIHRGWTECSKEFSSQSCNIDEENRIYGKDNIKIRFNVVFTLGRDEVNSPGPHGYGIEIVRVGFITIDLQTSDGSVNSFFFKRNDSEYKREIYY